MQTCHCCVTAECEVGEQRFGKVQLARAASLQTGLNKLAAVKANQPHDTITPLRDCMHIPHKQRTSRLVRLTIFDGQARIT